MVRLAGGRVEAEILYKEYILTFIIFILVIPRSFPGDLLCKNINKLMIIYVFMPRHVVTYIILLHNVTHISYTLSKRVYKNTFGIFLNTLK